MLALVMSEVERMANDPLPVAKRPRRVAALERELDELHRVEEVLVAAAIATGHPVHRSPSAPPAAVLDVRVPEGLARRVINENAARILPVFCFSFRPGPATAQSDRELG
jgi:hypothetical protein